MKKRIFAECKRPYLYKSRNCMECASNLFEGRDGVSTRGVRVLVWLNCREPMGAWLETRASFAPHAHDLGSLPRVPIIVFGAFTASARRGCELSRQQICTTLKNPTTNTTTNPTTIATIKTADI